MLERTDHIFECERVLSAQLATIRLIGQLPLTPEDGQRLRRDVETELTRGGPERIQWLMDYTPAALACFLVWKGILIDIFPK